MAEMTDPITYPAEKSMAARLNPVIEPVPQLRPRPEMVNVNEPTGSTSDLRLDSPTTTVNAPHGTTPAQLGLPSDTAPVVPRTGGDPQPDFHSTTESGWSPAEVDPLTNPSTTGAPGGPDGETGASIYENYDGQITALEEEAAAEAEQLAGAAGGGGGDPLTMLLGAGVSWLMGHISFLQEPLDALTGDAAAIQAQVDEIMQHATDLMTIANEHGQQMTEAQDWTGQAAEAFHGSMDRLGGELASMSSAMEGSANVTAAAGEMLIAVRDTVEQLITELISRLVVRAVTAMAWSPFTFGASVVAFIGDAVVEAAMVTAENVARIQELMAALQRQGDRMAQLGDMNEEIATSVGRFSTAAAGTQD